MWQIKNRISALSQYFGHKTYQGGDIMQEASTHKFEWPLNVRSSEVMWQIKYIVSQTAEDPWTSN